MKKNSSKNSDTFTPEELKETESLKTKTNKAYAMSTTLKKSLEIIELFKELDTFSKQVVVDNLKEILRKEKDLLSVDGYLNLEESALYLDVTTRTIQNYLKKGKLRGIKKDKRWYIPREELNKLL